MGKYAVIDRKFVHLLLIHVSRPQAGLVDEKGPHELILKRMQLRILGYILNGQ
jgi:hypothetical protein